MTDGESGDCGGVLTDGRGAFTHVCLCAIWVALLIVVARECLRDRARERGLWLWVD